MSETTKHIVTNTLWVIVAIIGMAEAATLAGVSKDAIFVSGVVIIAVMFNRSS